MQTPLRFLVAPMRQSVGGLSATERNTLSLEVLVLRTRFLRFSRKLRFLFWLKRRFGNRVSLVRPANDLGVLTKIAVLRVRMSASLLVTATLRVTAVLLVSVSHMMTETRRGIAIQLAVTIVARRAMRIVALIQIAIRVLLKVVGPDRGSASLMASGHLVSLSLEIARHARDLAKMDVSVPRTQLLLRELLVSHAMTSVSHAHLVSSAHLLLMRRLLFLR
jgi:hypothetical protein